MKTSVYLLLVLLVFTSACGGPPSDTSSATVADSTAGPCPSLVGSWELVSIAENAPALTGEFESDPNYQIAPTLKILNDTHWMFIRQSSNQFIHAQGGHYKLDNGKYTEIVEYSAIPENVGKVFTFDCQLEGDSLWHHAGGEGDYRYNEVWRRVH